MSRVEAATESAESLCRWCFEPLGAEGHGEIWTCEQDGATCHRGCVEARGRCPRCKRSIGAMAARDSQGVEVFGSPVEEKDPRSCLYSSERALTREDATELLNSLDPLRALQSELDGQVRWSSEEFFKFFGAALVGSQLFGFIIWAKVMPKEPWLATQLMFSVLFMVAFAFWMLIESLKFDLRKEKQRANIEALFAKRYRKSGREFSAKDFKAKDLLVSREKRLDAIWTLLESRQFERVASECRRELKKLLDVQSELEAYSVELFGAADKKP